MARYRMFVDESGTAAPCKRLIGQDPYLALSGVIFNLDYHTSVVRPNLEALKRSHFSYDPDDPPILHREDILKRQGCFSCLSDPARDSSFCDDLLEFLRAHTFWLVTVVLDKHALHQAHGTRAWEPYWFCLSALLSRFMMFLGVGSTGDVLAEGRGPSEDRELRDAYARFYQRGDHFIKPAEAKAKLTTGELKVKTKDANIAGLQIADMIVTESKREIVAARTGARGPSRFGARLCATIQPKYRTAKGIIRGAGQIWLPEK